MQGVHPVLAAYDVTASLEFFGRLGFTELFRDVAVSPKYAAVRRDEVELHIQWAAADQWLPGIDRPAYRFLVSDVDALFGEFMTAGGLDTRSSHQSPWARPANTPWGTREFHIRDPGENSLQFYKAVT
jgi:catechol 2,3-dioxygenase-like lactoylglutathione lyase family enzyme